MKSFTKPKYNYHNFDFYILALILIAVPLSFWKGLNNGIDLIKASVFFFTGGLFIIFSCAVLINDSLTYNKPMEIHILKTQDFLILIFLTAIIISTIFSINPYISIVGSYKRQIGLLFFVTLWFIYFFSAPIIKKGKMIEKIFLIIEIIAFIVALYAIFVYSGIGLFNLQPENFIRPITPVGHPVFSAGFITLILPVSLLNVSNKKNQILKIIFPFVMLLGLIVTMTRAAYIATAAEIILILILYPFIYKVDILKKKRLIKIFILLISVIIIISIMFIVFFPQNIFVKRTATILTITQQPRWYLWRDSFEMFKHFPLTGTGLSMFSNAFENFASYNLKLADVRGIYDNAHNNIVNTFCTTGTLGGISYLSLLIYIITASFRRTVSSQNDVKAKIIFLSILSSISGYIIFGLADFDDITILLYLFILFSIFKAMLMRNEKKSIIIKKYINSKIIVLLTGIALIIFSTYNIYSSAIKIAAEKYYSEGMEFYKKGDFKGFISSLQRAMELEPRQSEYRFFYAQHVFEYCSAKKDFTQDVKNKLYEEAKAEMIKAEKDFNSRLMCLAQLSIIELDMGDTINAAKVKAELFKTDTCQFSYRNNLARYYMKHNNDSEALKEIKIIIKNDPKNEDYNITYVFYLERTKRFEEAADYCRKILEINPQNQFAQRKLIQFQNSIKK